MKKYLRYFRLARKQWRHERCQLLAAALAFYCFFSLAPLVIILIGAIDFVFEREVSYKLITGVFQQHLGDNGVKAIHEMLRLRSSHHLASGEAFVSILLLIVAASRAFWHLRTALNSIWHIPRKGFQSIFLTLRSKLFPFSVVAGAILFFGLYVVVSTFLTSFNRNLVEYTNQFHFLWPTINLSLSFFIYLFIFVIIYKLMPERKVSTAMVLPEAIIATALFSLGKYLVGLYFSFRGYDSSLSVLGSAMVVLFWIYYSAIVLFFGAKMAVVRHEIEAHQQKEELQTKKN